MAYKDRDEFLDDFFDHMFDGDEATDEDVAWFDSKVGSFFDKLEGVKPPGRRRAGQQQQTAAPKRRRSGQQSSDGKQDGGYGLSLFYGGKKEVS